MDLAYFFDIFLLLFTRGIVKETFSFNQLWLVSAFQRIVFVFISNEQKMCGNLILCPADSRVKKISGRGKFFSFSEFPTSLFITLVFSFELIIWHTARSASASLSDHIYAVRQRAHTPALPHKLDGQRHVPLSHMSARVRRFHTGDVKREGRHISSYFNFHWEPQNLHVFRPECQLTSSPMI